MRSATPLVVALVIASAAVGRADPPVARPAPEAALERFQLPKGAALLLVPVEFKGKSLLFALDTGTSSSIYDSSLTPLLGDPIATQEVRTHDGVTRLPLYASPDAKLGRLSLRTDSPVATADFRSMREGLGEEVYGFIGMDFLSTHTFRIDPDRGEIVFLRAAGAGAGEKLPVVFHNKVPYVAARVAGLADPVTFLVDTGYVPGGGTGLLRADTYDRLAKLDKIRPIDTALAGSLSGLSVRQRGRVGAIELAGHRHSDLIFSAAQHDVLGVNYWSRYVATFDFAAEAIYLQKGRCYDHPDTHDLSGITMVRAGGRTVVVDVDEGTCAARAGVKPRDVIVRVNGSKADEMALMAVRRLLAGKGTKISLSLERAGGEREVTFELPH